MNTIARNNTRKKNKTPEITRLLELFEVLDKKPFDIAKDIEISERTITNFIWNDSPIGGQLLRKLHLKYGASIDWILSGTGSMFAVDHSTQEPPANYAVIDQRTWRLQRFIADFIDTASPDEQAWLEMQIKFSVPQYAQFLEQLENECDKFI